jgi:penicillin amidase
VNEVRRDAVGVPHLVADTVEELARLQGRTVARDRTWQVEHSRLRAEGRTAALLGERALPWDRMVRRVGIEDLGRRAYDGLQPASRAFVDAFVAGVNEHLTSDDVDLTLPELVSTGHRPGRWQPWTPLAVFAGLHVLFASFPTKLWRRHLDDTVGREVATVFHDEGLWVPGSNAWAVGGDRTRSGKPLVGGDPHRSFESPNVYAQVRLTCPPEGIDVAGFTFPGVPGVQHFAHAGDVAWGITNAMADYQDVYEEHLERRGDEVWWEGPDGWARADVRREVVEVRDGDPEEVEVVVTGHGPVFHGDVGDDHVLSLRAASLVLGELGFDCLLPLLRSRTSADVEQALAGWVEPVNNLVVADVHGDVRHRVVGAVPQRLEENRWRPVPGWDPTHVWTGWLDDLPHRRVPADGHVVTANQRMGEDYDRIGVEFAPPGRADRITSLLEGRDDLDLAAFAGIHGDTLAGQPLALAGALEKLDPQGLSARGRGVREDVLAWDQHFDAGSTGAGLFAAVRDALVRRLAASPPFDRLADAPYSAVFAAWFMVPVQVYLSLTNVLSDEGRAVVPDVDRHLVDAVEEVAAGERPGPWGERHVFQPFHALGHTLERPPALSGDNDCVRCTGTVPGASTAVRGSVARYVWDLAGLDRSGWVVPMGASGDPRDPHHRDQMASWTEATLLPVV